MSDPWNILVMKCSFPHHCTPQSSAINLRFHQTWKYISTAYFVYVQTTKPFPQFRHLNFKSTKVKLPSLRSELIIKYLGPFFLRPCSSCALCHENRVLNPANGFYWSVIIQYVYIFIEYHSSSSLSFLNFFFLSIKFLTTKRKRLLSTNSFPYSASAAVIIVVSAKCFGGGKTQRRRKGKMTRCKCR